MGMRAASTAGLGAEAKGFVDVANVVLYAVGYNFRCILARLRALVRLFLLALIVTPKRPASAQISLLTDEYGNFHRGRALASCPLLPREKVRP
jgi:hypothetical protein